MRYRGRWHFLFLVILVGGPTGALLSHAKQNQISVKLFGQPCFLKGDVSKKILNQIHSITPENVFPVQSAKDVKKSQRRVDSVKNIPTALKPYLSQLTRYLEAHRTFFEASKAATRAKDPTLFLERIKPFVERNHQALEHRAQLFRKQLNSHQRSAFISELLEIYKESTLPSPEEEFHRGLDQMKIRYNCEFDRNHEAGLSTSEDEEE